MVNSIDELRTGLAADLVILEEQNEQNQISDRIMAEITTVYTSVYDTLTEININRENKNG